MGLFTDLFGGSSTKTMRPEPWKDQQPYLNYGFDASQGLYDSKKDTPWYQGDLYAGINGIQSGGANTAWDYLTGMGGQLGKTAGEASTLALGAGSDFLSNAGSMFSRFGADPTQGIANSAAAYAYNPYTDGMIDAASRDVVRNLEESQITGLNTAAVGTGNMNSTRAGVAEGIMRRGAADRIGDISSTIRGDAYREGLGMATDAYNSQSNNMLNSNLQLGQLFGAGLSGLSQVGDIANSNFGLSQSAGGVFQGDAQSRLDELFAQWSGNDTRQQDLLNNYWANIGTEYGSGSPVAYQDQSTGALGQIASTVSALTSAFAKPGA